LIGFVPSPGKTRKRRSAARGTCLRVLACCSVGGSKNEVLSNGGLASLLSGTRGPFPSHSISIIALGPRPAKGLAAETREPCVLRSEHRSHGLSSGRLLRRLRIEAGAFFLRAPPGDEMVICQSRGQRSLVTMSLGDHRLGVYCGSILAESSSRVPRHIPSTIQCLGRQQLPRRAWTISVVSLRYE